MFQKLARTLFRRKKVDLSGSSLKRRLNAFDLTALGIGSTLAIVVSFLIAGVASIFAGMCYAEFGARVPKAGSAYVYSYVTVGEFIAWITGWNLILEYIIGAASVARSWSAYFDTITGHAISEFFMHLFGHWDIPGLGSRPDFFALLITMLLSLLVGLGVKESTMVNNVLTVANLLVVAFVVFAGIKFTDSSNWSDFAPYGVTGIFRGAATCFYAYIGFDVIATSAEETKKPEKNIPIGIISSLFACALSYMSVAAVVTLMQRYSELDDNSPLADAFGFHHVYWAKTIISIGALSGLSTSLMASLFPLPRIVYSIAGDGLLFQWLGKVNRRFGTPLWATFVTGSIAGIMAFIFDVEALADMMSIGTLMSYTLVAACVIILRFRPNPGLCVNGDDPAYGTMEAHPEPLTTTVNLLHDSGEHDTVSSSPYHKMHGSDDEGAGLHSEANELRPRANSDSAEPRHLHSDHVPDDDKKLTNYGGVAVSSNLEARATLLVVVFVGIIAIASLFQVVGDSYDASWTNWVALGIFLLALIPGAWLCTLPQLPQTDLKYKCPLVPILPLISVAINVYLLISLSSGTWIRFGVWTVLGIAIYIFYSASHSKLSPKQSATSPATAEPATPSSTPTNSLLDHEEK